MHRRLSAFFLTVTASSVCAQSQFDHMGPELGPTSPVIDTTTGSLFEYESRPCLEAHSRWRCDAADNKTILFREREQFGYDPRYMANSVTFHPHTNLPFIRVGLRDIEYKNVVLHEESERHQQNAKRYTDHAFIQTLQTDGKWTTHDLIEIIRSSSCAGCNSVAKVQTSVGLDERVVFDENGGAYTIVHTEEAGDLLLYSPDNLTSWQTRSIWGSQSLQDGVYRIEYTGTNNDRSEPPVILHDSGDHTLSLLRPSLTNGTLSVGNPVKLTEPTTRVPDGSLLQASIGAAHSGAGNATVTIDGKTHVVFLSKSPTVTIDGEPQSGTSQYIITFDPATYDPMMLPEPKWLGHTGVEDENRMGDIHNVPVIAVDSNSELHVILGSHVDEFKYVKLSSDASQIISTEVFGGDDKIGNTYASFTIDSEDTLHVVSRGAPQGFCESDCLIVDDDENLVNDATKYPMDLQYHRRSEDGDWEVFTLIRPEHLYSDWWYQKTIMDHNDRIFLSYVYAESHLTENEKKYYINKWGDEEEFDLMQVNGRDLYETEETYAHDPVIIFSDDGGNTWRLATTQHFIPEPSSFRLFVVGFVIGLVSRSRSTCCV